MMKSVAKGMKVGSIALIVRTRTRARVAGKQSVLGLRRPNKRYCVTFQGDSSRVRMKIQSGDVIIICFRMRDAEDSSNFHLLRLYLRKNPNPKRIF